MSEVKGTESFEKTIELLAKAVIIGKKVYADKEFNFDDLQYSNEFIALVKETYEFIQSKPDFIGEAKDISIPEVLAFIAKADAKVKEIEKA